MKGLALATLTEMLSICDKTNRFSVSLWRHFTVIFCEQVVCVHRPNHRMIAGKTGLSMWNVTSIIHGCIVWGIIPFRKAYSKEKAKQWLPNFSVLYRWSHGKGWCIEKIRLKPSENRYQTILHSPGKMVWNHVAQVHMYTSVHSTQSCMTFLMVIFTMQLVWCMTHCDISTHSTVQYLIMILNVNRPLALRKSETLTRLIRLMATFFSSYSSGYEISWPDIISYPTYIYICMYTVPIYIHHIHKTQTSLR